jgi:putative DNA primase/helicase
VIGLSDLILHQIEDFGNIPHELKKLKQFVLWKLEPRPEPGNPGKMTKPPYNPNDPKKRASVTDPNDWGTYDQVIDIFKRGGFSGIGFVFTKAAGYVGIDFDHCIDAQTGDLKPGIIKELYSIDSYTEISASGTGIHVILRGEIPKDFKNKEKEIEIYSQDRYFTFTGNYFDGILTELSENPKALKTFYDKYLPESKKRKTDKATKSENEKNVNSIESINIETIENDIIAGKHGEKVKMLQAGDWRSLTEYAEKSQSEADLGYCDQVRKIGDKYKLSAQALKTLIDTLYRRSGMMRPKWDEQHGDQTYGESTIDRALIPLQNQNNSYFSKSSFLPWVPGMELLEEHGIKKAQGRLYFYEAGVYRADIAEDRIRKVLADKLGPVIYRPGRVDAVIQFLKDYLPEDAPEFPEDCINTKSGLVYWQEDPPRIEDHDPNRFFIIQIPAQYDKTAESAGFVQFLDEVTMNDSDLKKILIFIIAYCLTKGQKFQIAFILTGAGKNGKSVYLTVLRTFFGLENISSVSLQDLNAHKFAVAQLIGKLANIFADLDSKALESASILKAITGGDAVLIEEKFERPFSAVIDAKLIFSANKLPRTPDQTYGFFRRLILIPFERTFEGAEDNPNLVTELTTPMGLSGILNLAIGALKELALLGFPRTPKTAEALKHYELDNDSALRFLSECIETAPGAKVERSGLYQIYKSWCHENGFSYQSSKRFNDLIRKTYPGINEKRPNKALPWMWLGIQINTEIEDQNFFGGSSFNDETVINT